MILRFVWRQIEEIAAAALYPGRPSRLSGNLEGVLSVSLAVGDAGGGLMPRAALDAAAALVATLLAWRRAAL